MLRNIFLVSLLIYAVCAFHLEIRDVDSAEEELEEIPADTKEKEQIVCLMCIDLMGRVKKSISSKATPDEIKNKLNNICEKTWIMRSKCKKFVQKHLSTLVDELMTDDGPKKICTKVRVCKPEPPIKEFIFNNF